MKNETKQTAVEWLVEECHLSKDSPLVIQAKQMEKEQMIEFAQEVFRNRYNKIYELLGSIADDIYNETYGGDK